MNKAKLILCCMMVCAGMQAQDSTVIKGRIQNVSSQDMKVTVYVRNDTGNDTLSATCVGSDNTYTLTVPYTHQMEATLDCGWQSVQVWLCNENLTVDFPGGLPGDELRNEPFYIDQKGGSNAEVMNLVNYENYRNFSLQFGNSSMVWNSGLQDNELKNSLSLRLNGAVVSSSSQTMRFIATHYAARPAVMAVLSRLQSEEDISLRDSVMNVLSLSSDEGKSVVDDFREKKNQAARQRENVQAGKPAPDIAFVDFHGKDKKLSDYIGRKILVVDFWASWCKPCRKEIPGMKRYYEEFRHKGVEFLSISLDKDSDSWLKALQEEDMPWPQATATDAGREAMDKYQFNSIPVIMIIDRDGTIYRNKVRGYALKLALEELLGS